MILPSGLALRLAAALAAFSLLGAVVPVFGWACVAGIALLALLVTLDGRRLPRIPVSCQRRLPPRLSLGEPEQIVEELRSACDFALEVRVARAAPPDVALEPLFSPTLLLGPRAAGEVHLQATASRRGRRTLARVTLRVGRPRGLALRQYPVGSDDELAVYPNVARVKRYEKLRQLRALSALGIHRTRYGGLGSEFDHLRSYARGDDLRRIHWKATARRGHPITSVVRTERGQSVLLALDVSHWMGISVGTLSRLDHAVDAALFLAHVARGAGDQVGLALFGNEVTHFLAPTSKPGQIQRMLEALAPAQPLPVHPSYRNLARYLLARRLRRSLVVVITEPVDPESASELSKALVALRSRHLTLCVGLRDPALLALATTVPEDTRSLCLRLAAAEVEGERRQRLRHQREQGLQTLDVLPAELCVSLVNRYLELKSRAAL